MLDLHFTSSHVDKILEVLGVEKNDESCVHDLLHHMYVAVYMFQQMGDRDRAYVVEMQKKMKKFFVFNCKLKERKSTRETEKFPPHPLNKEKGQEEKAEKTTHTAGRDFSAVSVSLERRRDAFKQEVLLRRGRYTDQMLENFFNYWGEEDPKTGKMKFEFQKTWNIDRRLKRWLNNSYTSSDAAAAIRLKRTRSNVSQQEKDNQQLQVAAQVRQQQEEIERQKAEENKAGRMSIDEFIRQNPDSMMAKMYRETHKEP